MYKVKFPDGEQQDIGNNVIAKHLVLKVDEEGNQYQLFVGVVGHQKSKATIHEKMHSTMSEGKKCIRRLQQVGILKLNGKMGAHHGYP
jgi:hypothetical protein